MWKSTLICTILFLGIMNADAVGSYARAGGYAGANGYGTGGYTGGYNGYNGYNDDYGDYYGFDYAPNYASFDAFIDPYLFHQQLTAQILAQQAAQQNAIVTALSSGNAQVWGSASSLPDNMQMPDNTYYTPANTLLPPSNTQLPENNEIPDDTAIQRQIASRAYYNNQPHRYAPNYSAASGSIGHGGAHQTAYISPGNPAIPNVVNRFSEVSPGGGYKGVSVSSFSSSSDVDGKKSSQRGAQTTINDNGKITSYAVHS